MIINDSTYYVGWSDMLPASADNIITPAESGHKNLYTPMRPIQAQLKGLEFGNGFFTGNYRIYKAENNAIYYYSGYYGDHNEIGGDGVFIGGYSNKTISGYAYDHSSLDCLLNLEYIKLPKVNYIPYNFVDDFLNYSYSLKDVYYNGTKEEWDSFFTHGSTSYLNEFIDGTDITTDGEEHYHLDCFRFIGDNYSYRGRFSSGTKGQKYYKYAWTDTYTLTIHCLDSTFNITLEPTDKWISYDFSQWQLAVLNPESGKYEYK